MFQEKALAILKSGRNVFLTGSAGTGKTYTLNQYIQWLHAHRIKVAITASTGIAATHMNGTTIHSWSGIGIKNELKPSDLRSLKSKKYLTKNIEKTNVLIIDEISMLHKKQLDLINQALKYLKNNPSPFGGMQVVFAGDFFQLPPVSREQEPSKDKFAFMSKAWVEASPTICYLTEQYRQTNNELNNILNQIRSQEVDEFAVELLNETAYNEPSIEPTRLYTHNADVDSLNEKELEKIDAAEEVFFAQRKGNPKLMEAFVKNLIVQEKLVLKKGAKVMLIKNNAEAGYFNGTLGVVTDFIDDDEGKLRPVVQLSDKRKITVKPDSWSILENERPIVEFIQIPLRLAWAITVHKSQGMTLEAAEIDLSKTFEPGQGYVALSRLRDLNGLRLVGINRRAIEVDALAVKADHRFRELSEEADSFEEDTYKKDWNKHILNSGGTTDKKELKKHQDKQKAKKNKVSTYQQTVQLIEKGKTLEQIAEERGLSLSTIQGHILKIGELYPKVDISAYRPDEEIMQQIEQAYNTIAKDAGDDDFGKDGMLHSNLIYNALNKKVDYAIIKLAYAFLE